MTEVPFAFDLHVLSTPPAFVLSQDQTLQFYTEKFVTQKYLTRNPLFVYYLVFKDQVAATEDESYTKHLSPSTSFFQQNLFLCCLLPLLPGAHLSTKSIFVCQSFFLPLSGFFQPAPKPLPRVSRETCLYQRARWLSTDFGIYFYRFA